MKAGMMVRNVNYHATTHFATKLFQVFLGDRDVLHSRRRPPGERVQPVFLRAAQPHR